MRIETVFPELERRIPVEFEQLYVVSDGISAKEAERLLESCNMALEDKRAEKADNLSQLPGRIQEIAARPLWAQYVKNHFQLFMGREFPPNTDLVFEIPFECGIVESLFENTTNLTSIKMICANTQETVDFTDVFRASENLKRIDLTEFQPAVEGWYGAFYNCKVLEEIIGELDCKADGNGFANAFQNCEALREVRFKPNSIPKNINMYKCAQLSEASVDSVIQGLMDRTGEEGTLTLRFAVSVGRNVTEAQRAAITAKNWSLAY